MRVFMFFGAVVGVLLATQARTLRGDPGKETDAERIARLVQHLGDDAFAKREAASKQLTAIGAPALAALRKAAVSSEDLEIRLRAKRIVGAIAEATLKAELAKLQGVWAVASYEIEGKQLPGKGKRSTMTITGDTWILTWAKEDGGAQVESGILKIVNPEKGGICRRFCTFGRPTQRFDGLRHWPRARRHVQILLPRSCRRSADRIRDQGRRHELWLGDVQPPQEVGSAAQSLAIDRDAEPLYGRTRDGWFTSYPAVDGK
jgi:hypothetical protein